MIEYTAEHDSKRLATIHKAKNFKENQEEGADSVYMSARNNGKGTRKSSDHEKQSANYAHDEFKWDFEREI